MVLTGLSISRLLSRAVLALSLLVSLGGLCAQTADTANLAGTMPEDYLPQLRPILERAAQLSPERMLKLIEIEQHEARVIVARSGQLPYLGGSFNYGTTESAVSGSNTRESSGSGFFYNASASQAIFHWGALKNSTEIARLQLLITRKDTARVTRDLLAVVRKTYLALVVQKAELQSKRRLLQLIDGEIETLTIRNSQGLIPVAQLNGEKLRRREEQLKVDRLEAEFAADRRRLSRIAALPQPLAEADIADGMPNPTYSEALVAGMTAALLRDNARNSFEYEIYDIRVREAKLREKVEATRLLPKFGANVSYSLRNNTSVDSGSTSQEAVREQSLGIGGNWPLFDGFATRGYKREALAARRYAERQRSNKSEEIMEAAQKLERTLKLDREQISLSETRQSIAVELRRQTVEESERGNIPRVDVQRVELGVLNAELGTLASRVAYLVSWTDFVTVAGTDPVLSSQLPASNAR